MFRNQVFCLVEQKLGQWILEYHPVQRTAEPEVERPSTFVVRSAQAQISKAPAAIWHERLAHCGPEVLEHLPTSVTGVRLVDGPTTTECEVCGVSKAHKVISRRPSPQAEESFDRVHWDMIHFSEGFNGDRYASYFLDDKTRMNWVYTHSEKTQQVLLDIFEEFTAYIERQFSKKIKIFRIDGETSLGKRFDNWATDAGIDFEISTPYSPEQNGSAERSRGVIVAKARYTSIRANLSEEI
jgi:transposase InsO family protein